MESFDTALLVEVALDLANSINTEDRFDRLLTSIRKAIKCDAVALLGLHENLLTPLATQGLAAEVLGRRFLVEEHPRLAVLCQLTKPYIFPDNCELPDPYDGLLLSTLEDLPVHSCMGLPLYSDQKMIGLVTIDSLHAGSFNKINIKTLELITALSAATLKTALELKKLEVSAQHAQELVNELTQEAFLKDGGELIGQSELMASLKKDIELVAHSDYTVLITGETGVGKELVARKLHKLSMRQNKPLVHVNCASLPETLVETELFGHTKGAFTGAEKARAGKFQLANNGSLFLDEIGELPLTVQSKLLRVLQSGEIQPVGQDNVQQVNVRIIAATNRNLEEEVRNGRFRADLFHRLSVYPIWVPPLRQRQHDILLLAGHFLEKTRRRLGIRQLKLSSSAENSLLNYTWPGNVRELEHVISRASLKAKARGLSDDIISLTAELLELPQTKNSDVEGDLLSLNSPVTSVKSLHDATQQFQHAYILDVIRASKGNWSEAARILKMDRSNLVRQANRVGIIVKKMIE